MVRIWCSIFLAPKYRNLGIDAYHMLLTEHPCRVDGDVELVVPCEAEIPLIHLLVSTDFRIDAFMCRRSIVDNIYAGLPVPLQQRHGMFLSLVFGYQRLSIPANTVTELYKQLARLTLPG